MSDPITRAQLSIDVVRYKDTIFIPLPHQCWQPIPDSKCVCRWCLAHPELVPMWDTMVVNAHSPKKAADVTHLCHYPEIANRYPGA